MPTALQAVGWALRPLPFLDRCRARYGSTFTLRVRRGSPWILLTEPNDIKQVFTADAEAVSPAAVEPNPVLGPLLGPRSVMLLEEPEHMTHRRNILPSFHGERMRDYSDMMVDITKRELEHWPIGEPFALWPRMQAISGKVIFQAVFGEHESERLLDLRNRLVELTAWLNDPRRLATLFILGSDRLSRSKGFRSVMGPVEDAVLQEARRRRCRPGVDSDSDSDILSILEQANKQDGSPMTERELRDELVTLLSDGPTSTSLAWAFERLLHHPEKLGRLLAETLDGEGDLYADAVVRETLRLCPVVPLVSRRLRQPMNLGGYEVPPDTVVAPCVYLTHRREDLYPDPLKFKPERFLESSVGTYTWIPFGGGVRRCLAANFAQLAMKRIMQTVLGEMELRPVRTRSEGATRSSVSFAPGAGALVIAHPRSS
jgi:cytochrome P450